jgi:subtilisin-like proprotein convertase family protein
MRITTHFPNVKVVAFILFSFFTSLRMSAQVAVTSTGGTTAGTYTTLNAAFVAVNAGTHTGSIEIALSANVTETAAAVLNSSGAGSASYSALKIYPTADNVTISGPTVSGRGLIELNGADNVTIDGDNPNTSGANRNLTITNTAAATVTYSMAVRVAVDATTATTANSNTIRNCIINGNASGRNASGNTSTTASENLSYGIYAGNRNVTSAATNAPAAIASTTTVVGTGATFANLTVDNNQVNACARAIMIQGSASTVAPGLLISNNTIGAGTTGAVTNVYSFGIGVQGSSNGIIRSNIIQNIESYLSASIKAISVGEISSVAGDQFIIEKNSISNVISRNIGSWASYGINITGGTGNVIQNNFIYGLNTIFGNSNFGTAFGIRGVRIASGTGHKIYHNTVSLSGATLAGGSAADVAACLTITSNAVTGADVRNNIFSNTMTGAFTGSTVTCLQLPSALTSAFALTLNNNTYYSAGSVLSTTSGTAVANTYTVSGFSPAATTPAANPRAYTTTIGNTSNDNASYASSNSAPFISASNLHLNPSSSEINNAESKGANVGVTADIDGESRGTTPDIGADEIIIITGANDAGISAIATASISCPGSQNVSATIKNFGTSALTSATVNWSVNGVAQTPYSWTGNLVSNATANIILGSYTFAGAVSYTIVASTASPNAGTDANSANDSTTSAAFQTALSGTYTVGAGGNFTNLTAATAYINTNNICGPTIFSLTSGYSSSGETFPLTINALAGSSAVNILTIKPASGATVRLSGSSTSSIFKLNGADFVIIDGSNTVGGTTKDLTITNTNTNATTAVVWLSSLGAGAGSTNNIIKNNNIATGTLANLTYGIILGGASIGVAGADNDSNTIENNTITVASNAIDAVGTSANVNDNLMITNNTISYTNGSLASIGIRTGQGLNGFVAGNTITASSSVGGAPVGISIETGFTSASITKNKINAITTSSTFGFGSRGITIATGSAASNLTVANNTVYGINGSNFSNFGSSSSLGIGLGVLGSSNTLTATTGGVNLYYNSVNMYGTYTRAAGCVTTALYVGSGASALDIRNNIFVNAMSNTNTGSVSKNYAIYSAAANTAFTNINYNDYYASGTQGVLGFLGSDATTLAGWKTTTGKDANSLSVDPLFVGNTNLHLGSTTPSAVESAGTVLSVTDDIDGDARGANPDMGADEISIVVGPNDAGISAIPTLGNNCPGSQNVTVTLKNFGTAALSSVTINWSVNNVAQAPYSWTGTLASGATTEVVVGTYNFSGVVSYTVSAASNLPNGAADSNSGNDSKTGASFQIALSGTYTVGTGGSFTTLTSAVAYANTNGLCGATLFSLLNASYSASETFPVVINTLSGASSVNTLTIKPNTGVVSTISGSNASAVIKLNGADYVTIDGSNTLGGTGKNLTISNTNTGNSSAVVWIATASASNGATNNTIKNTIVSGNSRTTTYAAVASSSTTGVDVISEADNAYNTVQNCTLTGANYGVGTYGGEALDTGWVITGNTIGSSTTTRAFYFGIDLYNAKDFTISNNTVSGIYSSNGNASDVAAIRAYGTVNNGVVHSNTISDVTNGDNTAGYAGIGIYLGSHGSSSNVSVYNNMIYDVKGVGFTGFFAGMGIWVGSGGGFNIYYNSVSINSSTQTSAGAASAGLYISNGATNLDIRNNIFYNYATIGNRYSVYSDAANTAFSNINNNDYYSAGAIGYLGAALPTLAGWKAATGKDANSISVIPPFVSATNLHIASGCTSLESAGVAVAVVTKDIDNETRSSTATDIGADEFIGSIPPKVNSAVGGSLCGPGSVVITATGSSSGAAITEYRLYTTAAGGAPVVTAASGTIATPSISTTTNYYVAAFNGCESETRILATAIINPAPTDIILTSTLSPPAADECSLDYVKLEAAGGLISSAVTVSSGTVNLAIPDNSLTTGIAQTLTVAGIDSNASISKIEVKLNITHTYDSDLRINLEAPNGKIVNLVNQAGAGGENFTNTIVTSDTSAAAFSTGTAPLTGTFKADLGSQVTIGTTPAVNTAIFSDLFSSLNGSWKVRIYDGAGTDTGTLTDCSMTITYLGQQVTWSPATGLYTDTALTVPYVAASAASVVYAAPTTATSYTAKAAIGTCEKVVTTASVERLKKEFRGTVDNNWNNAANWFPAQVPDNDKCASIPVTKTVIINVNNAEAKSLTIAGTGKTIITAGNSLKVTGAINITNNASNDNLTINSDGNLLQSSAVANTGNVLALRGVHMRKMDYTYWSSPVTGQKLLNTSGDGFSVGTPNNRIFYYYEPTDNFKAVPATETTFINAKGYAIRGKDQYLVTDPANNTVADEFKFTGIPNNGGYSVSIQKSPNTGTGATVEHGYNLIGNPYPSNMDFVKFYYLGNNSNVINAKAWFWSNVTPVLTQSGSSYSGNNYATITLAGATPPTTTVTSSTSTGAYIPSKNIKLGQAFIVQAKNLGTNQTLTYDNTIRTNESGVFFNNKGSAVSDVNRYWLMLTTPENIVNTILVGHLDGATNNYDADYDAELLSVGDDSFYSKLNTRKLQIQARNNLLNTEDVIPLGAKYASSGAYQISLGYREGIFAADQKIYLYDKLNNLYTDLTAQNYTFTANKGLDESRFEIVYKNKEILAADGGKKSEFEVYRDGESFVVKSSRKLGRVELYDAGGKLIMVKTTSEKEIRFDLNAAISGMYIIKADNDGNVKTKKIMK